MLADGNLLQNRYHVRRALGSGGFATVFLADDTRLAGRRVAVKAFDPARLPSGDQEWARQAFQQEATVLARLNHPGIADVSDFFSAGGIEYLVMEYVEGETLEAAWQRTPGHRFSQRQVLAWAGQLCDVLDYLHQQNPPIIFRDLKPGNVMVQRDGALKLIDFGIARYFKPGKSSDTEALGTPGYAAPEQFGHGQTDVRSDVYSLAVVLYQLLSGYNPAATPLNLPPLASLNPTLSPSLVQTLDRALQLDANLRYRTISDFAAALGVGQGPPTPPGGDTWKMAPAASGPGGTVVVPPPYSGQATPPPHFPEPAAPATARLSWKYPVLGVAALAVIALFFFLGLNGFGGGAEATSTVVALAEPTTVTPEQPGSDPEAATATPLVVVVTATVDPALATEPAADTSTPSATPPPPATDTLPPPPSPSPAAALVSYQDRPIVFSSARDGRPDNIFIMNYDGSGEQRVTTSGNIQYEVDLSPDGRTIAYEERQSERWLIYTLELSDDRPRFLVEGRQAAWSPDGRTIAYESGFPEDIYLFDLATGSSQPVITGPTAQRAPSWSPDGNRIVFMEEQGANWQLVIWDLNQRTGRTITGGATDKRFPVWSPDGELIAYNTLTRNGGIDHVWVIDPAGSSAKPLTRDGQNGRPAWSPDGRYIAFNRNDGTGWYIYRMERDGSSLTRLSSGGDSRPDWGSP